MNKLFQGICEYCYILSDCLFRKSGFFLFFFCCIANLCIGVDIESGKTFVVILSGLIIFSFVNYILCVPHKLSTIMTKNKISPIYGILGLIITALLIYVNYTYIMNFSAAYGFGSDFFEAMVQYKIITTLKDAILVPSPWYRGPLGIKYSGGCIISPFQNNKR